MKNNADTAKEFELPITLFAELQYALTYEMVVTPVDFFLRRTGAVLFNIHLVNQYKENVIQYMQSYFNWDPEMTERYQRELEEILKQAQFVSEH